jgi:hypothetical protein
VIYDEFAAAQRDITHHHGFVLTAPLRNVFTALMNGRPWRAAGAYSAADGGNAYVDGIS